MPKRDYIPWDDTVSAAVNARRHLPSLVSAYFAQGRELLAREPGPAQLHTLRLATKRLRYTLDLFRSCYGPAFRARMEALRRLQQLLGELHDCTAASACLIKVARRKSPQRARIESFLRRRAQTKSEEFRREWREVFDAPGQERWWTQYLSRRVNPSS